MSLAQRAHDWARKHSAFNWKLLEEAYLSGAADELKRSIEDRKETLRIVKLMIKEKKRRPKWLKKKLK